MTLENDFYVGEFSVSLSILKFWNFYVEKIHTDIVQILKKKIRYIKKMYIKKILVQYFGTISRP